MKKGNKPIDDNSSTNASSYIAFDDRYDEKIQSENTDLEFDELIYPKEHVIDEVMLMEHNSEKSKGEKNKNHERNKKNIKNKSVNMNTSLESKKNKKRKNEKPNKKK